MRRPSLCIWAAAIKAKGSPGGAAELPDPSVSDGCGWEKGTTMDITDLEGFWFHTLAAEAGY